MKILQIIPNFGMGGAENMCETIIYELIKANHSVTAVSLYNSRTIITDRLLKNHVNVIFLNKNKGFDFKCIRKLKKLINNTKPDVIHTHLNALKYVILATLFKKIRIVHTIHNIAEKEAQKKDRIFNRFFYKIGKVVPVALSNDVKKTVLKEYNLSDSKVPVVLNGVDLSKCMKKTNYEIKETFKIINVARFNQQKNHKRLIEAFKILNEQYSDMRLQLIGDGELKDEIKELVNSYGLHDKVEFLGIKDDVYMYLHNADCFVLSSDYEGIPMSIIEAMGTALPIVSTNVGGLSDMIVNGKNGFLVGLNSYDLKKEIEKVYLDKNIRQAIGLNALKESIRFSSETMTKRYLMIYKEKFNE